MKFKTLPHAESFDSITSLPKTDSGYTTQESEGRITPNAFGYLSERSTPDTVHPLNQIKNLSLHFADILKKIDEINHETSLSENLNTLIKYLNTNSVLTSFYDITTCYFHISNYLCSIKNHKDSAAAFHSDEFAQFPLQAIQAHKQKHIKQEEFAKFKSLFTEKFCKPNPKTHLSALQFRETVSDYDLDRDVLHKTSLPHTKELNVIEYIKELKSIFELFLNEPQQLNYYTRFCKETMCYLNLFLGRTGVINSDSDKFFTGVDQIHISFKNLFERLGSSDLDVPLFPKDILKNLADISLEDVASLFIINNHIEDRKKNPFNVAISPQIKKDIADNLNTFQSAITNRITDISLDETLKSESNAFSNVSLLSFEISTFSLIIDRSKSKEQLLYYIKNTHSKISTIQKLPSSSYCNETQLKLTHKFLQFLEDIYKFIQEQKVSLDEIHRFKGSILSHTSLLLDAVEIEKISLMELDPPPQIIEHANLTVLSTEIAAFLKKLDSSTLYSHLRNYAFRSLSHLEFIPRNDFKPEYKDFLKQILDFIESFRDKALDANLDKFLNNKNDSYLQTILNDNPKTGFDQIKFESITCEHLSRVIHLYKFFENLP